MYFLFLVVGMHDEGSAINSLFGLIFWDVIYEHPVADVFRSSYQQEPLDLRSGEFYRNRKETVDKRLEDLCHWDMKCVKDFLEKIFKEHEGKECVVNWQRFHDLRQIVVSDINTSNKEWRLLGCYAVWLL
jgi:Fanconi-associated nuclease 1